MSDLTCTVMPRGGTDVLVVEGEASVSACPELEAAVSRLIAANPDRLIVDLRALAFMSSLGIGQLMMLAQHIKRTGGCVAVVVGEGDVRTTLERCRMHQIAPFEPTLEAAQATLAAG